VQHPDPKKTNTLIIPYTISIYTTSLLYDVAKAQFIEVWISDNGNHFNKTYSLTLKYSNGVYSV